MSETKSVIPNEAIEAAAKAYYELGLGSWESAHADTREVQMEDMRAALEAVAPHFASLVRAAKREGLAEGACCCCGKCSP